MRLIAPALFGLVVTCPAVIWITSSAAFAQQARGGFGNALSPGTGAHLGTRLPATKPIATRPAPPPAPHPQHSRTVVVPYPVYYGGYYYAGYYYGGDGSSGYAQPPAPSYDYGLADAAPGQSPVVIVNQGYRADSANPVMRDYSDAQLPPPGPDYQAPNYKANDEPTIYLLAMTDHTIIPAIAYWVDSDTLNYITTEGSQNRVSLSLIDHDFSRSLNDTRGVEFRLPPAK